MGDQTMAAQRGDKAPSAPTADLRFRTYLWLAIVLIHVWIISAGKMWPPGDWPDYGSYSTLLTDAFVHGQCHLLIEPHPRLLALPDPYDPTTNRGLKIKDALLYNGKYYFYWGPVPALLLIPVRVIFAPEVIPERYLVLAFTEALVAISARLMVRVRQRFFPNQFRYTLSLVMVAAALAMPLPFLLARPSVYETSILAGQLFLLGGIYFAFTALTLRPRVSLVRLSLAGLMWAMAVGSRLSLAIAVFVLSLLVAWRVLGLARETRQWKNALALLVGLGMPLAAGAVLMGAYNHVRFGSWHESGQRYQLAGVHLGKTGGKLFSVENVLPNLYSYAFRPWQALDIFPFIIARRGVDKIPSIIRVPPHYHSEEVTGIVWTTPVLALAIVPAVLLGRSAIRRLRRRGDGPDADDAIDAARGRDLNWLVLCLLCAAVFGFAPIPFLIGSTMRYFADLTPALFVLAAIGLWQAEAKLVNRPRLRIGLLTAATVSTVYSCVIALPFGLIGYYAHFPVHNRELFLRLSRWFGS